MVWEPPTIKHCEALAVDDRELLRTERLGDSAAERLGDSCERFGEPPAERFGGPTMHCESPGTMVWEPPTIKHCEALAVDDRELLRTERFGDSAAERLGDSCERFGESPAERFGGPTMQRLGLARPPSMFVAHVGPCGGDVRDGEDNLLFGGDIPGPIIAGDNCMGTSSLGVRASVGPAVGCTNAMRPATNCLGQVLAYPFPREPPMLRDGTVFIKFTLWSNTQLCTSFRSGLLH